MYKPPSLEGERGTAPLCQTKVVWNKGSGPQYCSFITMKALHGGRPQSYNS